MAKCKLFSTGSSLAAALTLGFAGAGMAQQASAQEAGAEEDIVVTGSYIRGTPEDAALPVDVITAETLAEQGSPTVVQLVRTITAAGASFGEGYRFGGAPAGAATVNLRGLGGIRTLVLMNGRRFAPSVVVAGGNAVDLNMLPQGAIGRVEVLRDGAAATYGSDAVGGVVNFITRRDLDGFEIDTEYTAIEGSDGDYRAGLSWGWQGDNGNILISAGYRHRSELQTLDRDWAVRPYAGLPSSGGWSGAGNPGSYLLNTNLGVARDPATGAILSPASWTTSVVDPGCVAAGGAQLAPGGTCQFQFSRFENLTNPEDNYSLYSEVNYELAEDLDFHAEIAWFRYNSDQRASPMNQTAQFPAPINASGGSINGGGVSPFPSVSGEFSRYYIPPSNPGLAALFTACAAPLTGAQCAGALSNGVLAAPSGWRPAGNGGNLYQPDGSDHQFNENDGFRFSTSVTGSTFWDVGWNAAVTYTDTTRFVRIYDQSINRLQLALRGLGGPSCDPRPVASGGDYNPTTNAPTPASVAAGRCSYWNPFSNSTQAYTGVVPSPQSTNPALANNAALARWMTVELTSNTITQNLTGDFVLDGSLPIELWGGPIQWAAGVQYRYDRVAYSTNQAYDITRSGCPDSQPFGDGLPLCNFSGSTLFFVGNAPSDIDRVSTAIFAETRLPVTDNFEISAAIRHEEFSGLETTDPRISARWQVVDFLALRASAGSTFRAPPQSLLIPEANRGLTNFTGIGVYRPTDLVGNPNLRPESADTYSAGFIVDLGNFRFTADYFNYVFQDEITTESATGLFSAFYTPAGGSINGVPQAQFCASADPTVVELRSRINFASGCQVGNSTTNFLGLNEYNWINGGEITTSGIDFSSTLDFDEVFGGALTFGVDGTYLMEWSRGALTSPFLPGITIQAPIDRVGRADGLVFFYSYPRVEGERVHQLQPRAA